MSEIKSFSDYTSKYNSNVDFSALFSGTSDSSSVGNTNMLSDYAAIKTGIEISYIPRDLITVIFYYQISLNPLKTQSLSQVSFPLLFPLRYIVPPVFTNSDKGKNKGKKII